MPRGKLGLPRLTSFGPLVKEDDEWEWNKIREENEEQLEKYGF